MVYLQWSSCLNGTCLHDVDDVPVGAALVDGVVLTNTEWAREIQRPFRSSKQS